MPYKAILESGRLLIVEQLERDFVVRRKPDGTPYIEVIINGRGFDAAVHVLGDIIEEDYFQIKKFEYARITNNIGPKREEFVIKKLKEIFLNEQYLCKSVEFPIYYLYGRHNISRNEYPFKKATLIRKIKSKNLELLTTDITKDWRNNEHKRYIYYYNNQLYIRNTSSNNLENEEMFQKDKNKILYHLYSGNAIDENGHLYEMVPVNDPNNIRLFYDKENIEVKSTFHHNYAYYSTGATLKEIIEQNEELNGKWDLDHLPISIENLTIHSERVIGTGTPDIMGKWVKITDKEIPANGLYGQVIKQFGPSLRIWLEKDLPMFSEPFHISQVNISPNPTTKVTQLEPVMFAFRNGSQVLRGFGYIQEKYPNYYKIGNVFLHDNIAEDYIRIAYGYHRFSYLEENTRKELDNLDFFVVPKESVMDIPMEKEMLKLLENYDSIRQTQHYQTLFHLIHLSKAEKMNYNFFALFLYLMGAQFGFNNIVHLFSENLYLSSENVDYKKRIDFKDEDIFNWILRSFQ